MCHTYFGSIVGDASRVENVLFLALSEGSLPLATSEKVTARPASILARCSVFHVLNRSVGTPMQAYSAGCDRVHG